MIDKNKILEELNRCNWPAQDKEKLVALVSQCGPYGLEFLNLKIQAGDSELVTGIIVQAVQACVSAVEEAKKGNASSLSNLLELAPGSGLYDFGRYVIPFMLDFKKTNSRIPNSIYKNLLAFECQVFKDLPLEELENIAKNNLLYFLQRLNVIMEFERIYYYRNIGYDENLSRNFLLALTGNEEEIGDFTFALGEKQGKPSIKNWLKDFIGNAQKRFDDKNTFSEIQYLQKSSYVANLPHDQQQLLLTVFKLYDWLQNPEVDREEILAYEKVLEEQGEEAANVNEHVAPQSEAKPATEIQEVKMPAPKTPPVPQATGPAQIHLQDILQNRQQVAPGLKMGGNGTPIASLDLDMEAVTKAAAAKRKQQEEAIDKKLEALKKKANS